MSANFKFRFWKTGRWFLGLFILLFVFRLIYGYVAADTGGDDDYSNNFFGSIGNIRKNYASENNMKGNVQMASAIASNQKFEKTASVRAKTSEFEKDEEKLKVKVKQYSAIIQYEQNLGQKGNRQIHLLIGVNPAKFDSFYNEVQKIGVIKATQITKVDKTNEYRQLNAKKASIEKTLQSLNDLKAKGGQIIDFVALNEKIMEIEDRAQELGVELGNFDSENEFCTVKLSIYEGATEKKVPFLHRLKVAFEWTVKYFGFILFTTFGVVLTTFLMILIVDKLKVIPMINKKLSE